ncbi:PREDICTED: F-box/LRR-repeat protein 12-like [Amphimedon queenslandica]|uniref:F-box domain-containing protein n=1 Tax=Amphimedon queenslandica TaxID=400682 RepID=A0A1X7VRE8_AMPQE|nr:PREDICTED: F-box/LRR-repeat protein 12-like [Amphimedon queenslandica]|eukprot:XP_011409088.1 PREDICTED: F-box/LRR-repeat protein 12-like [Amphimedon queenslandica]
MAKRDRWSSEKLPIKTKKQKISKEAPLPVDSFSPEPNLDCLPDTLTLYIMGKLDIVSLVRLARTCKRFYHLHREECLWTNVDMTTLPQIDVRKMKKIIENYVSPKLQIISIQSNFRLNRAKKPKIDGNVLDFLFKRCPSIKYLRLLNCDLSEVLKTSLSEAEPNKESSMELLNCSSLERVSLLNCNTPLLWLSGASWPILRHLSLAHSVMTSHLDVQSIFETKDWQGTLKSLDLTGCYRIKSFGDIKVDLSIEILNLSETNITDSLFESLPRFPCLRELYLRKCSGITNSGILKIPLLSLDLQIVDFTGNDKLSLLTVEQLRNDMPDTEFKY